MWVVLACVFVLNMTWRVRFTHTYLLAYRRLSPSPFSFFVFLISARLSDAMSLPLLAIPFKSSTCSKVVYSVVTYLVVPPYISA